MIVGIHQPHYLPWLRYFEKIARSDTFVVLDNIQYNKNGWQNRNFVKGPSGRVLLTVPVYDSYRQTLDAVRINNKVPWRKKHARTIEQFYGSAPHFDAYAPAILDAYTRDWEFLNDLNRHKLHVYLEALQIETPIVYASDLQVPGEATDRLVNLVRAVGGDTYYSGAYALEVYLDAEVLAAAGIGLALQEWEAPVYPQRYGAFEKDLSIVDLIMNCGPEAKEILLGATA
jgi:hypothetical protein